MKPHYIANKWLCNAVCGRSDVIRTRDLSIPNAAPYQLGHTPILFIFSKNILQVVNYVVKRDFDRESRNSKVPWCCTFKGFVRKTALQAARVLLCSQMSRATNCATPRLCFKNPSDKIQYHLAELFTSINYTQSFKLCQVF